jgi:hypothetical protein
VVAEFTHWQGEGTNTYRALFQAQGGSSPARAIMSVQGEAWAYLDIPVGSPATAYTLVAASAYPGVRPVDVRVELASDMGGCVKGWPARMSRLNVVHASSR